MPAPIDLNLDTIELALKQIGLRVNRSHGLDERLVVHRPQQPNRPLQVLTDGEGRAISFAMIGEFKIPQSRFVDIACAIAIANGHIEIGAWCFNSAESEIYYRLTLPSTGTLWTQRALRDLIELALGNATMMFDRFQKIALNNASFETVLGLSS